MPCPFVWNQSEQCRMSTNVEIYPKYAESLLNIENQHSSPIGGHRHLTTIGEYIISRSNEVDCHPEHCTTREITAHYLEYSSLGIGNFHRVDVDLIIGFLCLQLEKAYCSLLCCHCSILSIVKNSSMPSLFTFNKFFIIVVILFPEITE